MATDPRRKPSCWTCRLRHKKCDQSAPICGGCAALGIDCHPDSEKPEWMDKGVGQHKMATQIKGQVKRSAKQRRTMALMESIAEDLYTLPNEISVDSEPSSNHPSSLDCPGSIYHPLLPATTPWFNFAVPKTSSECTVRSSSGREPLPATTVTELELGLITAYMDYIFPILHPSYKPPIVTGGRSWLLSLSMKSKGFLRSVVSLSSLFLSVIPSEVGAGHDQCTSIAWDELRHQADMALASMQCDLKGISGRGVENNLLDSVYLLASIMQLLNFELAIMPSRMWQIHLDAAIGLFEQILELHGKSNSAPSIYVVLRKMKSPSWTPNLLNADQGAFRFFSTMLLVDDIISSTALESTPRLLRYHADLECNESSQEAAVKLDEITGCQTWVLVLIGDIATLNSLNKDQARAGELSKEELLRRGTLLERRLQDGLNHSERVGQIQQRLKPDRPLEALVDQSSARYGPFRSSSDMFVSLTQIWAYAARVYLFSVLSNGRLDDPEICSSVEQAVHLFMEIGSPIWLRSLVWPICVVACHATEAQRPTFRAIADSVGALGVLGTLRSTFSIIEGVWRQRDNGAESCDIATCLKSLGHVVLLV